MENHEVRIVAELRKQGEHERAEEFRLKAMRRTPRRIPEHLVPLAGTPSDSAAPALTPCVADDDHSPAYAAETAWSAPRGMGGSVADTQCGGTDCALPASAANDDPST